MPAERVERAPGPPYLVTLTAVVNYNQVAPCGQGHRYLLDVGHSTYLDIFLLATTTSM